MKHATLSASSSARWLTCTASIKAIEGLENKSSPFAAYGTDCHELADRCLTDDIDADSHIGVTIGVTEICAEDANYVQQYVDYVRDLGGDMYPEQRVDFSNYIPNGFGTADAIVVDVNAMHLHVCDLKMGKGVPVYAEDNTQGMLYAIGVLNDYGWLYDVEQVTIHIVQPRIHNFSQWTISVSELLTWAEWAKGKAQEAISDQGVYKPSEKACKFCPAKATCKALFDHTQAVISAEFDDLTDCSSDRLTDEQLRLVMDNADLVTAFISAVKDHVKDRLDKGEGFEGYKLVAGRSNRKLKPEAEQVLTAQLGDDVYDKKLKGVTALEKLVGKKAFAEMDLTFKPDGAPTVVHEGDKRQAIQPVVEMFDKL